MDFISTLSNLYRQHSNAEYALQMKNYMKGHFEFFGIKATLRRQLLNQALSDHNIEVKQNWMQIADELYKFQEREFHMCAMEIINKYLKNKYEENDIIFIEKLITHNAWWDSVDFIAKHILGNFLHLHKAKIPQVIEKFSKSENIWLKRSTIIFQLGYKESTNQKLLFQQCVRFSDSNEFFIKKAIGWSLREYSKIKPEAVLHFVNSFPLKPLSQKEAIRNIKIDEVQKNSKNNS